MIDRFGKTIVVGLSQTERLWIEAANTLPHHQQMDAFIDIARMSGRPYSNIVAYARNMKYRQAEKAREYLRQELNAAFL